MTLPVELKKRPTGTPLSLSKVLKKVDDEDADYDPRKNNAVASKSVGFTRKPRPRTEDFLPMYRRYSTRHKSYSSLLHKAHSGLFDDYGRYATEMPRDYFHFPTEGERDERKEFQVWPLALFIQFALLL